MRLIALALLALSFSSCATQANYRKQVDSWVGRNEKDLIMAWGAPDSSYAATDSKLVTYNRVGRTTGMISYGMLMTKSHSCKTTFSINTSGLVESATFQGNDCKSN